MEKFDRKDLEKDLDELQKTIGVIGIRFGEKLYLSQRDGKTRETIEKFKGEFLDRRQLSQSELKSVLDSMEAVGPEGMKPEDMSKPGMLGMFVNSWDALFVFLRGAALGYEHGSMPPRPAQFPRKNRMSGES